MSLREAAKNAGKEMVHSSVKRIIRNKYYVGDEHYPAIISKEIFAKANAELILRSERHQRPKRLKTATNLYRIYDICPNHTAR